MRDFKTRTALLLGQPAMDILQNAKVAVIGLGGVGAACAEALVRAGVGTLIAVDHDTVDVTNLNRQLFATAKTIGMDKTQAAAERLLSINPQLQLIPLSVFYNAETKEQLFSLQPDIIVDAIDTVSSKLDLALECQERSIPLIASLGTGNRLDPTLFRLGYIEETGGCGCPLARVMRRECKKRGIQHLPVLFSTETPKPVLAGAENGRHSPASISFCPPVAGYAIASWVIKQLIASE